MAKLCNNCANSSYCRHGGEVKLCTAFRPYQREYKGFDEEEYINLDGVLDGI